MSKSICVCLYILLSNDWLCWIFWKSYISFIHSDGQPATIALHYVNIFWFKDVISGDIYKPTSGFNIYRILYYATGSTHPSTKFIQVDLCTSMAESEGAAEQSSPKVSEGMNLKALVIGGTGAIGKSLIGELLSAKVIVTYMPIEKILF